MKKLKEIILLVKTIQYKQKKCHKNILIKDKYPLRTAVASATVAGMIKKELADTASWKRLM